MHAEAETIVRDFDQVCILCYDWDLVKSRQKFTESEYVLSSYLLN